MRRPWLKTSGIQSLTVTDTFAPTITGSQTIHVAGRSFTLPTPDGSSVVATSTGNLTNAQVSNDPPPPGLPPGVKASIGVYDFTITNLQPGGSAIITLTLAPGHHVNSYYKYGPTSDNHANHWYNFAFTNTGRDAGTGAVFFSDHIDLHFIDGKRGDDDLTANGTVNDPGAPADTDSNTLFVTALYQALLNREVDDASLNFWVTQLQNGLPRASVAQAVWESPEHRAIEVDGYYQTYLHRNADIGGHVFWVGALQAGLSETDVSAAFLGSPEYQGAHASVVSGWYTDVLGRAADVDGLAFWQTALQSGMTPGQVARAFLQSRESLPPIIDGFYATFLQRASDTAGEQFWVGLAHQGATLETIGVSILAADEFSTPPLASAR